jgi:hypothetical protein
MPSPSFDVRGELMQKKDEQYGICGVYCGQCPNGNGRVSMMAQELKRLVDTTRYEWVKDFVTSFSFDEFRKGLEWFSDSQCPKCHKGGGAPWCENRKCATSKNLRSCLLCDDYLTCKNTVYQRETYPFVVNNHRRVKEVGFEKHLEEEEERSKAGISLMGHLERRCCKVMKLEEKRK